MNSTLDEHFHLGDRKRKGEHLGCTPDGRSPEHDEHEKVPRSWECGTSVTPTGVGKVNQFCLSTLLDRITLEGNPHWRGEIITLLIIARLGHLANELTVAPEQPQSPPAPEPSPGGLRDRD